MTVARQMGPEKLRQSAALDRLPVHGYRAPFEPGRRGRRKMSIATKVIYDRKENTISLEKHQTSPVQLTNQTRASRQPVRSQGTEIVRID